MKMELREKRNINRVLRHMAAEDHVPVWFLKRQIQDLIDRSWAVAQLDPADKAIWDQYFPEGKPTTEEYILLLGRAQERGIEVPYMLKE